MPESPYENCTEVSLQCPVVANLYGYSPNLAANLIFTVIFGICAIIQVTAGIRYRAWTYMGALSLGCLCECAGYIGRVVMHFNVWNEPGFQAQLSCLIQGPSYLSAGIYLTLKHIVLNIDQRHSRLKAARYTWIFISCDCVSLGLQAAGGGIAAANDNAFLETGTHVMIAGIIFQVVVLVVFGYFLIEYFTRIFHHRDELDGDARATLESRRFRWFMAAIVVGFLGIFTRCVYRIPELFGGWGSSLMRDEPPFIILEGVMICLSTLALTACHPGWCFPAMVGRSRGKREKNVDTYASQELGGSRREGSVS